MVDADMLEHADRDDAVEALVEFAIVLQVEMDAVLQTLRMGAVGGDAVLFGRQRDALHVDVEGLRQIEAEPAPAGADVEHRLAGLQPELGGDVALLGGLRLVERHVGLLEIGAGILHVLVEEEPVEVARQVVVALHVAARARVAVLI